MDSKTPPPATPNPIAQGAYEVGYASAINNYLVWINGLPNVQINELVLSESKARGVVTGIKNEQVEVMMLDDAKINPNEKFIRSYQQLSIKAGSSLIGRTINPLGVPIDGKGPINYENEGLNIEQTPIGINGRQKITRQFETGISLIDMLIPISYGQRELIIGDSRSGKTSFLIDLVVNQKKRDIICVFALIGKPSTEIRQLIEVLTINKATDYTVIVAASSSETAPLIYLTPAVGVTIAEYFQKQGRDVLLILDDLGIHAKFYREISLLSRISPGRESYPGNIFYEHAKLVERAGNFTAKYGGRSITALPVIETNLDDFSGYMPTNLMGMTDGHLLFNSVRYRQGHRPSVDISLSVSRVGRQTQSLVQKKLSDKIKALLAEATKLDNLSRLGSDVSAETLFKIKQAHQMEVILNQSALVYLPIVIQNILLGLVFTDLFGKQEVEFVEQNKPTIIKYLLENNDIKALSESIGKMADETEFIKSLAPLLPQLEKICVYPAKPTPTETPVAKAESTNKKE